jgi:hypothetical protein
VTAALIGGAAVAVAAIFSLSAALMGVRAPSHVADVTGLSALVDQLQEERNTLAAKLAECQQEAARLRGENRA